MIEAPKNRLPHLRVKIISLAVESRVIRREEKRCRHPWIRLSLSAHRRGVVRSEARASHLASAFIRGKTYRSVERTVRPGNEPDLRAVAKHVVRFGSWLGDRSPQRGVQEVTEKVREWLAVAQEVATV